jgi:hypothetical protein
MRGALYAVHYHGRGRNVEAQHFLKAAIAAGQRLGGVRLAVPYDVSARVADAGKNAEAARAAEF